MKTKTNLFLEIFKESRTRFTNQLEQLSTEDLKKTLAPSPNSLGFLIRHIGDVELLFAKNVFGDAEIHVKAKTAIDKQDSGEWVNLEELIEYVNQSAEKLSSIIQKQTESDWESEITTKEFGCKTKSEAFGRIVSHTAYHAGQMALILKYGS
jgi:uncharacterized damage-inducible protein DinB